MQLTTPITTKQNSKQIRLFYSTLLFLALIGTSLILSIIYSKQIAFNMLWYQSKPIPQSTYTPEPFPISVDPVQKTITQRDDVTQYLERQFSYKPQKSQQQKDTILTYVIAELSEYSWYQNLASANGRLLIIRPGARREEVTRSIAKILNWTKEQEQQFVTLIAATPPEMPDGKLYPASYFVSKNATPQEVADIFIQRFNAEIVSRYNDTISNKVPLKTALTLASLLEREAYDFTDMREISGIIWNRLFIDMNLQIDATLQYAKGTQSLTTWYPPVRPDDKYIESEFNTYANAGLPPSPIGNPSAAAVVAALNPIETDCLFYFHDKNSKFFCSKTYEEHVAKLKKTYGRGK